LTSKGIVIKIQRIEKEIQDLTTSEGFEILWIQEEYEEPVSFSYIKQAAVIMVLPIPYFCLIEKRVEARVEKYQVKHRSGVHTSAFGINEGSLSIRSQWQ
jgi:hypothetical protein